MRQFIENFHQQFAYEPEVQNGKSLKSFRKFVLGGMGGSHLAADLLKVWKPELDIVIHHDYGLPALSQEEIKKHLFIASSYSGNTEEAVDFFENAFNKKLALATVASGGKLLTLAQENKIPFIRLPDPNLQPRLALGYAFKALLKIVGTKDGLKLVSELAKTLKPLDYEKRGEALAKKISGFMPVIYASSRNYSLAYQWKVKFNETAKTPAFCNSFPELNHNEMAGFIDEDNANDLSENFYFIILKDKNDHPRILKRMEVLKKLYQKRDLPVEEIELTGENIFQKIFSSLIFADWASYYLAKLHDISPEQAPVVEEFKKLL